MELPVHCDHNGLHYRIITIVLPYSGNFSRTINFAVLWISLLPRKSYYSIQMSSRSLKFNSQNVLREVNLENFRSQNFPTVRYNCLCNGV